MNVIACRHEHTALSRYPIAIVKAIGCHASSSSMSPEEPKSQFRLPYLCLVQEEGEVDAVDTGEKLAVATSGSSPGRTPS